MFLRDRLGPHRAERSAQPGRELRPAFDDHRRRDAVREVDLGAPAWHVLTHRRWENPLRAFLDVRVDCGDAERADDHIRRRWLHFGWQHGRSDDRLVLRAPHPGQNRQDDSGERGPSPPRQVGHHGHARDDHGGQLAEQHQARTLRRSTPSLWSFKNSRLSPVAAAREPGDATQATTTSGSGSR